MLSYIATGEVTTLQHELRDDAVEFRSSVAKALFTGAKSTKVLGGLGYNVVVKVEVNPTALI